MSIYNGYTRKPSESTRALYIARYRVMRECGVGLSARDHQIEREQTCLIYSAQYRAMRARGVSLFAWDQ